MKGSYNISNVIILFLFVLLSSSVWQSSNQKEIDIWVQDQVTPPFQYYLMYEQKTDISLTSPIEKGDTVLSVSAGHGFVAGVSWVSIFEGDMYVQQEVKAVNTNDITIYAHAPFPFTTNASVVRGIVDMNADYSDSDEHVNYILHMDDGTTPIDIQWAHITIWNDAAQGDDSDFGDLPELNNGLYVYKANTLNQSMGNYRNNSDFRDYGGVVNYNDKSGGGGSYGVNIDFDIKSKYGIVFRIDPRLNDSIVACARDNFAATDRLRISLMGQYTLGE